MRELGTDTPGGSNSDLGSVCIYPKKTPQAAGDKPSPVKADENPGDCPPNPKESQS